jgi:deoxyadenosine/deoxycytidine kinase
MHMKKFVVVAGNIGVGKSSLVERLSQKMGWDPFYEPDAHNPYLADFYTDMAAWGFHSQIFFLAHRLRAHHLLTNHANSVFQDRSVYEDAEVFACALHVQGTMNDRDYATYRELYQALVDFLPPPDLVIYLRASVPTLLNRIALRARFYERAIAPEYLELLNRLYAEWIASFILCPVLTVPADNLDFVVHPGHLDLISQKVQEKLTGKEVVSFDPDEISSSSD